MIENIYTIDEHVDISDIGDMFSKNCFSFKHDKGCCWPDFVEIKKD